MPERHRKALEHERLLLDTAPDAMIVVDQGGRIDFVNLQTEKLFGYPRSELLGQTLDIIIPERFRAGHAQHLTRFFRAPTARPMGSGLELFARRKDGTELPIEVSLSPLVTPEGTFVSTSIRDVSERRRMLAELSLARRAAEDGSAAKTEFLSSMSHELRTPLNAVLGFAQLLQRDKKEPLSERHRARVEQILKGGEHLLRLIDDILDLSRIEAGNVAVSLEPVAVLPVLVEVRDALESMAARSAANGVSLVIDAQTRAINAVVAADRTRFAQILMNYGSNAIKYNRPNGNVTFRATVDEEAGRLRIEVTDTGLGIATAHHARLFQPFHRAGQESGTIEGTGIGLAISKRLAEMMDGNVGFESEPNRGSTFWIELPLHRSALTDAVPAVRRDASAPHMRTTGEARRLLLYVEDNPANVAFLEDVVSSIAGFDVVSAPNAEEGLSLVRSLRPDVVIFDINLPGMSGLDALREMKQSPQTADIPVIALTAAASDRDRQRGEQAGFYRYLTKPVKVDELEAALLSLVSTWIGDPGSIR